MQLTKLCIIFIKQSHTLNTKKNGLTNYCNRNSFDFHSYNSFNPSNRNKMKTLILIIKYILALLPMFLLGYLFGSL